ncbi:MAG: hypothetical protein ACLQNE_29865 [Thermoguttaceae bacterium]
MKTRPVIVCMVAVILAAGGHAGLSAGEGLSVLVGNGGTIRVRSPLGDCRAETRLEGCQPTGAAEVKQSPQRVEVGRRLKGPTGQECSLVETFAPTPTGLRWEVTVESHGEFWTAPIVAHLKPPSPQVMRFWTAWLADARDALSPRPFTKASWQYGRCNGAGGLVIPIATALALDRDVGLSWVVSPDCTILEAELSTTDDGEMVFSFQKHRLGRGRQVRLVMDLVPHEADWRGGLRWMVDQYPGYFNPPNPKVQEMAGCGCYSGADKDVDYEKQKKMGLRVRWEAAFDWPHMGIFLPPVGDRQTWTSNNTYRPSYQASFTLMNDRAQRMHGQGVWHLSYFNCSEFGTNMKLSPVDYAMPEKDLWKDPTSLAVRKFGDSMWRDPHGNPSCIGGDNGLVMDPASPSYRAHLLDQARRHLEKIPASDGLAIDRIWWSYPTLTTLQRVNYGADDGVGWYDGRRGRHYCISVRSILDDLGEVMHAQGKVVFYNPFPAYRLDCYRHVDGFFDENWSQPGEPGYAHAGCGLLGLRKPAIIWTYSADAVEKDAIFFDRHLLLGVHPMAPFPANDHSICPHPAADAAYLDYGPLLLAMRGKKWVLQPHCIEVAGAAARANLFEVPAGWVAPVVFGAKDATVKVLIRNVAGIGAALKIDVLQPGVEQPRPLTPAGEHGVLELQVPLKRGCAMVRLLR